jgi:hypothetical protein
MVSTLVILTIAVLSLFLVWKVLLPGLPQIRTLDDWESRKHEIDSAVFRLLLDRSEEHFIRESLSPAHFRRFQRARCGLALRSLKLVGNNAAMLIKLGHLARVGANPALAKEADELVSRALQLRVNLQFVQVCLWVKWLFPGWRLPVPTLEMPYEESLGYLTRVRQQRQWGVQHSMAS